MKDEVIKVIEEIRPTIQADGGDVELIDVDEKTGVVKVQLKGACTHCPMSEVTLKEGIGRVLKEKVKGVKEVVGV
ncbi:NifU family protein [Patescibacteria group bacterium]|nr:NifU family protein [Patescibacteria group bacterium]